LNLTQMSEAVRGRCTLYNGTHCMKHLSGKFFQLYFIKSRFLLRHSDGRVRIWRKQNEDMDPSCFVATVQAGGVIV